MDGCEGSELAQARGFISSSHADNAPSPTWTVSIGTPTRVAGSVMLLGIAAPSLDWIKVPLWMDPTLLRKDSNGIIMRELTEVDPGVVCFRLPG